MKGVQPGFHSDVLGRSPPYIPLRAASENGIRTRFRNEKVCISVCATCMPVE